MLDDEVEEREDDMKCYNWNWVNWILKSLYIFLQWECWILISILNSLKWGSLKNIWCRFNRIESITFNMLNIHKCGLFLSFFLFTSS